MARNNIVSTIRQKFQSGGKRLGKALDNMNKVQNDLLAAATQLSDEKKRHELAALRAHGKAQIAKSQQEKALRVAARFADFIS